MATKNSTTGHSVLLFSLFFAAALGTNNLVKKDAQGEQHVPHVRKEMQGEQPMRVAVDHEGQAGQLDELEPAHPHEEVALPIAPKFAIDHAPDALEAADVMGTSMALRACSLAVSLIISIVVSLYWRKGAFVIIKVLIYLFALSTMKGAVKMVEEGGVDDPFKFPLFLTATHFVSGAIVAFTLLLHSSLSNGVALTKPSASDLNSRFGVIAVSFALSVGMNNMALVYSTSAFVEIVGASGPIVTVLTTICMKQPFDMRMLAPCFVVFIGCALTSNGEPHFSLIGFALSTGSNLPRALKTVLQQLCLQQGGDATTYSPIEVLAWTCLPSSMIMLVWSFLQEGTMPWHQMHQQGLCSYLTAAVLLSCVNACILNTAILFVVKDLGAVGTQLVAQTKSMLVVLGGMCFLRETVSRMEFLGFLLVMIGVYYYNDLDARLKAAREAEKLGGTEESALMSKPQKA